MIIHCQNCGSSLKSRRDFGFEKCPKCVSLIKVMRTFGTGPQTHFFYEVVSCDDKVMASDSPGCYDTFESKEEAEAKCKEIGCCCIETFSMDDKCYEEYMAMQAKYKENNN